MGTIKEVTIIIDTFENSCINISGFKKLNGSQVLKENILEGYKLSETKRLKVFNPETDYAEDVPEITKEGYLFAKNRFFVARDFFSQSHINWTEHMFKFQEQRNT